MRFFPRFEIPLKPSTAACLGAVLGLTLWFSGCTSRELRSSVNPLAGPAPRDRISVMAYNVENFFDELHDEGHDDYPFLPLSEKKRNPAVRKYCDEQPVFRKKECFRLDWNAAVVTRKIHAVASSIRQVHGQGPDILILEEVENRRMLQRLNDEGLDGTYRTIVWLPGRDKRGIAVGLMSRFPLAGDPKLHQIALSPGANGESYKETRGILEVPLQLPNGPTLTVFGVHLPSQMNPLQERVDMVSGLRDLLRARGPDDLWIVGGDWNTTSREELESGLVREKMGDLGFISHIVGCGSCAGTHFYRGEWSFLDILVFAKSLGPDATGPYHLIPESIRTPTWGPGQVQKNGRPIRFNVKKQEGISDHLPIFAEIQSVPSRIGTPTRNLEFIPDVPKSKESMEAIHGQNPHL
jgi:endonuclease/exonuclease/phosphatase family metal-dependent hydrolase